MTIAEPTDVSVTTYPTRCGHVAIIGRPNVGKSTLLNRLLGQKISITCHKPQTTRHQILGVKTEGSVQTIYVDTPGIHKDQHSILNRYMNRAALSVINDVDVIVWVVESRWTAEEDHILQRLSTVTAPIILAINKVDLAKDKTQLLPILQDFATKHAFAAIIPISARQGRQLTGLEDAISKHLPEGPWQFDEDAVTDRSERFLVAEIIREKLMRNLGAELPYALAVEIEHFKPNPDTGQIDISAVIYIDRDSQKPIVIGKSGEKLKTVGREARLDINALLDRRVCLKLWVKVKEGWADDERSLRSLGYEN